MSNALQVETLITGIETAIQTAWGNIPVQIGSPRVKLPQPPYALIYWDEVGVAFGGKLATFTNTTQTNTITVIGRWPFPSDDTVIIDLEKLVQANLFIAQFQAAGSFAGIGLYPIVSKITSTESDDPNEKYYEVTLVCECVTQASHH